MTTRRKTLKSNSITFPTIGWCQLAIGFLVGFEWVLGISFLFIHALIGIGINFKLPQFHSSFSEVIKLTKLDEDLTKFNIILVIMTLFIIVEIYLAINTIIDILLEKKRIPFTFLLLLLFNPVPWEFLGLYSILQSKGSYSTNDLIFYMIIIAKFILITFVFIYNIKVDINTWITAKKIQDKIIFDQNVQEMNILQSNNKNEELENQSDEKKIVTLSV